MAKYFCVKTKTYSHLAVKVAEKSNRSFSVNLINQLVETSVVLIEL